jgi:hypothetical protein
MREYAAMIPELDEEYWHRWHAKWLCRLRALASASTRPGRRRRRQVTSTDIRRSWILLELPAYEAIYQPAAWWLAMSPAERAANTRPAVERVLVRAPMAGTMDVGYSLDAVGAFFKAPDGTVFRDRSSAARRLWRERKLNARLDEVVNGLRKSTGTDQRLVRGRSTQRVLDALVARSLVGLGMTQKGAAQTVLTWHKDPTRDPVALADREAELNRRIWRELDIPAVSVSGGSP